MRADPQPLAASLGAAFQAGAAGSSDITKAVGLTLYGLGLPRAALGEPFLAAFRAALSASRSHATGATSDLLSFATQLG